MSNPTCNRSLRYLGRPSIRLHLPFTPQSSLPLGHRRNRTLAAGGSGSRRFIRLSRSMTESLLASLRMRQTATLTFCIRIQALLAKALRHISMGASSWPYTVSAYQGSIQRRVWPPDLSSSTVDSKLILRSSSRFGALNCSATQCTSKSVLPNQSRPFSLCPRPPPAIPPPVVPPEFRPSILKPAWGSGTRGFHEAGLVFVLYLAIARHAHLWVSVMFPSAEVLIIGSITNRFHFDFIWRCVVAVTEYLAVLVG
jgi:hypothetical protein